MNEDKIKDEIIVDADTPDAEKPEGTKETPETPEAPETPKEKTFTQDELDRIIKDRLDRAMVKADKERKQAEELAKLSEKERAAKELEIKEQELEEQKAAFYRERLELQTSKELDLLGLPIAFTEYIMGENAEETQTRIASFNKLWETELEKRRVDSMRGKTPEAGKAEGVTKESILKIGDPIERKRRIAENIGLFG